MPLTLIAFWLLCLDVILDAEAATSSLVIVLLAVLAAVLALIAYEPIASRWRRP